MLNEFINFIKNDPIMLGLSCAIIFLVFVFILVLIFGGKKKIKEVEDNAVDNTSMLLKTDLETEPLKSTQEFTLNLDTSNKKDETSPLALEPAAITPAEPVLPTVLTPVEPVQPAVDESIPVPVEISQPVPVASVTSDLKPLQIQDVYTTETVSLPEIKTPHVESDEIPNLVVDNNSTAEVKEEDGKEETLDDIELPMLNTNKDTSVLSILEGEHYNI